MEQLNILTDASNWNKEELTRYGQNLITGCGPTNTNFTFSGTTYTLLTSRYPSWISLNSEGEISGDHIKIQEAEDARILVVASYKAVADQVNTQAAGNRAKLLSSGGILTEEPTALGVLPQAVIVKISCIIPGEINIELVTYEKSIGTMVYWKDLSTGISDKDFFAQKHIILLNGLISGHQYEITVAHKGSVRQVITSVPVKIYVQ